MLKYNAPQGTPSDIDNGQEQMRSFEWLRQAIITARKDQYFTQLGNTVNLPKHMGKTIKVHEYIPLLDSRNINDQGLDAAGATIVNGNLYGSSKDIGTITARLPMLSETGGRVNRVGFTRIQREGTLHKMGFFVEFTNESMEFDSDDMLMSHLSRELMNGAVQMYEAVLQRDLLAGAGVFTFGGAATSRATVTGQVTPASGTTPAVPASFATYANLMRLDQILTDNRTPKHTTIVTGSRNIDTRTLPSARIMYVGSELVPMLRSMTDTFGNKAMIEVQQYADATPPLTGEIGTIDSFRIVAVPEMLHWAGAGAPATANPGYRTSTVNGVERYNVYPMLVVGDDSFSTIGFQSTNGKSGKFNVHTTMPKDNYHSAEPYGETGFSSMKWYYGTLIKRPERIAILHTVAPI